MVPSPCLEGAWSPILTTGKSGQNALAHEKLPGHATRTCETLRTLKVYLRVRPANLDKFLELVGLRMQCIMQLFQSWQKTFLNFKCSCNVHSGWKCVIGTLQDEIILSIAFSQRHDRHTQLRKKWLVQYNCPCTSPPPLL